MRRLHSVLILLGVAITCLPLNAEAGKRSRRYCCPVPQSMCCPAPAPSTCPVCQPAPTCCQPRAVLCPPTVAPMRTVAPMQSEATTRSSDWICPVYRCMGWGGYCTYYSIYCIAGNPTAMNADCNLSLDASNCTTHNCPPCLEVMTTFLPRVYTVTSALVRNEHQKPKLDKKRKYKDPVAIENLNKLVYDQIGEEIVGHFQAKLNGGGGNSTVYVELRKYEVTPKPGQTHAGKKAVLLVGNQIDHTQGLPTTVEDFNGCVEASHHGWDWTVEITWNGDVYTVVSEDKIKLK